MNWLDSIYQEFGVVAGDFQWEAAAEYHVGEVDEFVGVRQILALEEFFGVETTQVVQVSFAVRDIDPTVLRLFHGQDIDTRGVDQ